MARALTNAAGEVTGAIAIQLPTARVQTLLEEVAGGDVHEEIYVIGADLLLRTETAATEGADVLVTRIETDVARAALAGESGVAETNSWQGP